MYTDRAFCKWVFFTFEGLIMMSDPFPIFIVTCVIEKS